MTIFCGFNQSYFMGFFFLISAYFSVESYRKKGARKFLVDRFIRLGIPVIFYRLAITPILFWLVSNFGLQHPVAFWDAWIILFYDGFPDAGPLWFLQLLLIFSIGYVACQEIAKKASRQSKMA